MGRGAGFNLQSVDSLPNRALRWPSAPTKRKSNLRENEVANQVGKRYMCTKCNSEMIVTKAGAGDLGCCGQPMQQK